MKAAKKAIIKQGPCAFCGDKYARHRVVEAQMEQVISGEALENVATVYDLTDEQMVLQWLALYTLYQDEQPVHHPT